MIKGRPLILSASRRTDLPGYHAESCATRIRRRIDGLRSRRLAGVVFWTKHIKPFLPGGALNKLVEFEIENPFVNLTVTGLGKTTLEPGAPSTEEVLSNLKQLVEAFHGAPWRIRWRFDPLIKDHSSLATFARIADAMASCKIRTCTFSFPAYRSLKGDLTPQFEKAGIPRWRGDEKARFLTEMANIAADLDIELLSCSQPENLEMHPSVRPAQCIPADLIQRGYPDDLTFDFAPDRSQRTLCRCIESEDIGDYERDLCKSECAYCYSKAGGPGAPAQAKVVLPMRE